MLDHSPRASKFNSTLWANMNFWALACNFGIPNCWNYQEFGLVIWIASTSVNDYGMHKLFYVPHQLLINITQPQFSFHHHMIQFYGPLPPYTYVSHTIDGHTKTSCFPLTYPCANHIARHMIDERHCLVLVTSTMLGSRSVYKWFFLLDTKDDESMFGKRPQNLATHTTWIKTSNTTLVPIHFVGTMLLALLYSWLTHNFVL
jgi:hypothetical protein